MSISAASVVFALVVAGSFVEPATGQSAQAAPPGPVEVLSKRTETSQTFANPDGTFTLKQSSQPVRTKKFGAWVDLDPTLELGSDGLVRPRATAMEMAFSGGGSAPLVTVRYDGERMSLTWPMPLPAPVVDKDTLLYRSVLPDVDLKVTVDTTGFSEVLIVRTPRAADHPRLRKIRLAVDAPGLAVRRTGSGGAEAIDELGRAVFTTPRPVMWDSRGDAGAEPPSSDRAKAPFGGDKVVSMPIEVSRDSITVTPSAALADDPAARYPLHIDPGIQARQSGRAMINQHYPTTSTWNWTTPEGVGYQAFEPWSRKRLFFQFLLPSDVAGTDILGSTLSVFETWAASCTKKEVQAWKTVRFGESATWESGSGSNVWLERLSSQTVAHGREGCDPGGGWVPFTVGSAVADMVGVGSKYVYLGLRAADESDQYAWKRFRADAVLAIHYNNPPVVKARSMIDPDTECATSAAAASIIPTREPIPVLTLEDKDFDPITADYELYLVGESQPRWRGTSPTKVPGHDVEFMPTTRLRDYVVSQGYLTAGVTWAWRARTRDTYSISPWTSFCYFYIDVTRPPQPSIDLVTTGALPIGSPITVRLGPNGATDLSGYRVGVNSDVASSPLISPSSPTYTFTPSTFGPFRIYAWSYDRANNQSYRNSLTFRVQNASAIGKWRLDEGSGTSTVDSSGLNHPMFLSPAVTWQSGNKWPDLPDHSVHMNGLGPTYGRTAAHDIVQSDRNFSVTARVRLGMRSVRQSVVSEDRAGISGFTLGVYAKRWSSTNTDDRDVIWEFAIPDPDGSGEIVARTGWRAYEPGEWVHLTGTYDANTDTIALHVNGSPIGTGSATVTGWVGSTKVPVDGTGSLTIGQAIAGGDYARYLLGQVDDVRIYNGAIDQGSARTLAGED